MTSQISENSVVAKRYASVLIGMAEQEKNIGKIEKDLSDLEASIQGSEELQAMISNPLISKKQQTEIILAVAKTAKLQKLTTNFLGVLVENNRLSALVPIIRAAYRVLSENRGEVSAKVQTAHALSAVQTKALQDQLSKSMGSNVMLDVEVDKSLLGGMVVTVGSRMIDDSVRNKLEKLERIMGKGSNTNQLAKEVG